MQSLNNDMDDLFRKAAEDYPLQTNGSDFLKIQSQLENNNDALQLNNKKTISLKTAFLFFLLLTGVYCRDYSVNHFLNINSSWNHSSIAAINVASQQQVITKAVAVNSVPDNFNKKNYRIEPHQKTDYLSAINTIKNNDVVIVSSSSTNFQENNTTSFLQQKTILETRSLLQALTTKEAKINIDSSAKASSISNKSSTEKRKRFFIGLAFSPEASSIKLQSVKEIGSNKGVIAGYDISRSLSIETGLFWVKKYYYSDGKYFSTKNITLPATVKIEDLNGNCSMYEIPLNLRYHFKSSTKAKWTTALGVSSYLMKNENYEYMYNNNGSVYARNKTYNSGSEIWLSALRFGLGYDRTIGKSANLRIEPYVRTPLKGIGIGALPITDFGVQVGFIKKLF